MKTCILEIIPEDWNTKQAWDFLIGAGFGIINLNKDRSEMDIKGKEIRATIHARYYHVTTIFVSFDLADIGAVIDVLRKLDDKLDFKLLLFGYKSNINLTKKNTEIEKSVKKRWAEYSKKEKNLLRIYFSKYIGRGGIFKSLEDVDGYVGRIEGGLRKRTLEMAKVESKLKPSEIELREKVILAWDMHESRAVPSYNDPNKCPDPHICESIKKGISLMKEISKEASLKKIKRILTPMEYRWFLPVYDEFKKTGKFTASNPHVRD